VQPVDGSGLAKIRLDVGSSVNADGNDVDTQRRVWRVQLPHGGPYRVTARGNFTGYGVNAQLWFGREPGFLGGANVWLVGGAIVLAGELLWVAVTQVRRRRRPGAAPASNDLASTPAPDHPASRDAPSFERHAAATDSLDRLERLSDLHRSGELTDGEFADEKAKLLHEP
jgi:hypothetical protein